MLAAWAGLVAIMTPANGLELLAILQETWFKCKLPSAVPYLHTGLKGVRAEFVPTTDGFDTSCTLIPENSTILG